MMMFAKLATVVTRLLLRESACWTENWLKTQFSRLLVKSPRLNENCSFLISYRPQIIVNSGKWVALSDMLKVSRHFVSSTFYKYFWTTNFQRLIKENVQDSWVKSFYSKLSNLKCSISLLYFEISHLDNLLIPKIYNLNFCHFPGASLSRYLKKIAPLN